MVVTLHKLHLLIYVEEVVLGHAQERMPLIIKQ